MKILSLGEILSIATGRLLCDYYTLMENLDYFTGVYLNDNEIEKAHCVLSKYIFNEYPDLEYIEIPELHGEGEVSAFLDELIDVYGNNYALRPLSKGVWV